MLARQMLQNAAGLNQRGMNHCGEANGAFWSMQNAQAKLTSPLGPYAAVSEINAWLLGLVV